MLGVPIVTAMFGRVTPWLVLLILALVGAAIGFQYFWMRTENRSISRDELEVDYLVRRVEEAVAAAGGASKLASAS